MTLPTVAPPAQAHAGPYAALLAQARRAPRDEALRSRRRGEWRAWSWQRLAAQAELAARGWAVLGVQQGDRIVALGPLGADLIVTLFAADALGATVVLAHHDAERQAVAGARFAFADGTHDLERLLRHRGPLLRAAVVGDAALVPASGEVDRVPLVSTAQLLARGGSRAALPVRVGPAAIAEVVGGGGAVQRLGTPESFGPGLGLTDRVFADFSPTWLSGLAFVLHLWPVNAPLLLIPEQQGDAVADQRDARANLWLAPADRLAATVAALEARVPQHGPAGWAARAGLAGRRSVPGALARWRIRAGMGLAATRHTISDVALPEPAQRVLSALGITPAPRAAVPMAARGPAAEANATGPAYDRSLVSTS